MVIITDGVKITSNISSSVRYQLGCAEAQKFYTKAIRIVNGVNKGGLGWSATTFDLVDWISIGEALKRKPEMLGLWLAKQSIGICATRKNLARIQDILDNRCPNCGSPREDNKHLSRCPDKCRQRKFQEDIKDLQKLLSQNSQTDPKLAFWIPYYLLLRGQTPMAELSNTTCYLHSPSTMMTATMRKVVASQDAIIWTEFLHGKVSLKIAQMQESYGRLANCRQSHKQWMKQLVERLILILHSQWLFRNFTLHHKTKGYLRAKAEADIKQEVSALLHTQPSNIPLNCQYLLEIKHSPGRLSSHEFQCYWVQSIKAAWVAIDREGRRLASLGSGSRRLESGQQKSNK